MLMTDPTQDFIRTALMASDAGSVERLTGVYAEMEREAAAFFADVGYRDAGLRVDRYVDARYHGQEHTVRVPVDTGPIDIGSINDRFHGLHERAHTYRLPSAVEIVNVHVVASVPTTKPSLTAVAGTAGDGMMKSQRMVDFDEWGRLESAIYERSGLALGKSVQGPAVIEEPAATTVIYPGQTATIDHIGNISIRTGA
jgi:N-methylhydantoinase A